MRQLIPVFILLMCFPAHADDEPAMCKGLRERITSLHAKQNKAQSPQMTIWLKDQKAKTYAQLRTLGCKSI